MPVSTIIKVALPFRAPFDSQESARDFDRDRCQIHIKAMRAGFALLAADFNFLNFILIIWRGLRECAAGGRQYRQQCQTDNRYNSLILCGNPN